MAIQTIEVERPTEWLVGGGEMGRRIRETDWRRSPLGPRERWPAALKHALVLLLESRFPNVLIWGRDLVVLYNDAALAFAGDQHPRALGRAAPEVWPEVWQLNAQLVCAVMERGEAVYLEDRAFPIARHGRRDEAFFTISFSPVRLESGAIGGTLITYLDTTSRVRRQRALEDQRARAEDEASRERELFAKVAERIPVMVAVYDPRGGLVHMNVEMQRVLGWTEEDARALDVLALSYPDPVRRAEAETFLANAEPGWRELTPRAKDGNEVPSSWATVRLSDRKQVVLGIDLPAQRRVNEQLREAIHVAEIERQRLAESEAQLRAIYEQNPAMVVLTEIDDGRIVDANARFTSMLGFSLEEARGRTPVELGIISQLDRSERILPAIRATGSVHEIEVRLRAKCGETITGLFSSTVVPVGGKQRLITVVSDITALKAAERALREANQRLEEADRRKTEFLAVLSHELRNPLAPIRQSVQLLQHGDLCGELGRRPIEIIGRQTDHMARLVDDLLDVMRITRGKITLHRERVELSELVRRTAEDYRAQYAEAGVALEVEVKDAPVYVDGDPARLVQVVGNLLHNSLKFTPPGGKAWVSVSVHDRDAVVQVRDDGVGMAPHAVAKLFEPFVQGPQTLDRGSGGLGLGLALVKGVVRMHGGDVIGCSDGKDRGSEFVVTLPTVAPPEEMAGALAPEAARAASSRRVLVIEDNEDAADTLHDLLELKGHEVMIARTGPEGVELARRHPFDVVLCDIGLPDLDGYGVARALRSSEDPRVRSLDLVALSGYALPDDVARSLAAGFDRHLAKPPSLEQLDTILAEAPKLG